MELDKNCVKKILATIGLTLLDRYYTGNPCSLHFESADNDHYRTINFKFLKDHAVYDLQVQKILKSYCDSIKIDFTDVNLKLETCKK